MQRRAGGMLDIEMFVPLVLRRFRSIIHLDRLFPGSRLVLCAAAGAGAFAALPEAMRLPVRLAAAWVVGATLFMALAMIVMAGVSPERMRRRARLLDQRRWVILAIIVAAAGISLLSLAFTLQKVPAESTTAVATRVVVAGLAVAVSWAVTHTTYALHYAHHYYGDGPLPGDDDRGGLAFPGGDEPDYWDFLYFSLVIGMTCQVSDVQVTSRSMRRVTLLHGVLSFFFNTVILALAVNLVAGSL
jgi:uncharacterized membrane protein